MKAFRLGKTAFANDLSGKGAERAGGRWNSKGVAMVYTSETRALCTAEIAVHTPLGNLPLDYTLICLEIPDDLTTSFLKEADLPSDWKAFPHSHTTQEIGDLFIREMKTAVLKVPSAVVQGEFNFLLNPNHPEFNRIMTIGSEPYHFDDRLFMR
ncbi:MAG: RES family NAD+ phosphorylase [Bacteroidetes bacterium]|nr:RES family NAD+ phosphorylase [Bacteroidota bacterium]